MKPRRLRLFNRELYFYRGSTTNNELAKLNKKFLKEKGHSVRTMKEGKTTYIYSKI